MNPELSSFAARLREFIISFSDDARGLASKNGNQNVPVHASSGKNKFEALALELFALQFENNFAYRKICITRGFTPKIIEHWTQIPVVPTTAFKELELTSLAPSERPT